MYHYWRTSLPKMPQLLNFREMIEFYIIVLICCLVLPSQASTIQKNNKLCGIREARSSELIVHGQNSALGEWPWHAAIYHVIDFNTERYACGGTLISSLFVLTAAHCVIEKKSRNTLAPHMIQVRLGVTDRVRTNSRIASYHTVDKIHKYDNYTQYKYDIALLQFDTAAEFTDYVQPICLDSNAFEGYGTVVGWGLTEYDRIATVLRKVTLPVIDPITCLKSNRGVFGNTLDTGMFCAGYQRGTNVCNGDSGGGLVFSVDDVWFLGGIVSFTSLRGSNDNRCAVDSYAVFTNVSHYLPWIELTTGLQSIARTDIRKFNKYFKNIDDDRSGKLSVEEISNAHTERITMDLYDLDRDGEINFKEFVKGEQLTRSPRNLLFLTQDKDKDGYLDEDEIVKLWNSTPGRLLQAIGGNFRTIMNFVDSDRDKKVSYSEFESTADWLSSFTRVDHL